MLENWNDGTMGTGKMGECCNGKIHLDEKVKNAISNKLPLKTNIPIFHHSIIPYVWHK